MYTARGRGKGIRTLSTLGYTNAYNCMYMRMGVWSLQSTPGMPGNWKFPVSFPQNLPESDEGCGDTRDDIVV